MESKKRKKDYLKIHIVAVNVKTKKILSMKVTATMSMFMTAKRYQNWLNDILKSDSMITTTTIGKLFGDYGTYEGNYIFRYCRQ